MAETTNKIEKEKFTFVHREGKIYDEKFETKPVGYFKDAFRRFKKNKSSVAAAIIILLQLLFAVVVPLFSHYDVNFRDGYYKTVQPTLNFNRTHHIRFWDGGTSVTGGQSRFDNLNGIAYEFRYTNEDTPERAAIKSYTKSAADGTASYKMNVDTYYQVGYIYKNLEEEEYLALQAYQNETKIQVVYPLQKNFESVNANYWYTLEEPHQTLAKKAHEAKKPYDDAGKAAALRNAEGEYVPDYMSSASPSAYGYESLRLDFSASDYPDGAPAAAPPLDPAHSEKDVYPVMKDEKGVEYYWYNDNTGYVYKDGDKWVKAPEGTLLSETPSYYLYAFKNQTGYKVRVCYYEYFKFINGHYPSFLFGTNNHGQDILTCLASGARLSFLLAIFVSALNLTIGAIYGAVEGYYGGTLDIAMERFAEILSSVPFIVVATLFQMHLSGKVGVVPSLLFAFVLTGWLGMAARVRMQFYRFKNQEYVLAARTLGAKDRRIMFKYIFPNSLGTIITGSVLTIPGVIFTESMLSYLGIVNLETSSLTSIGTMLSQGQGLLSTYPHVLFFPALFIALLEISFNLFGNGLRDAFNPSLRGTEA